MSARGMVVVPASLVTLGRTSSTRSPKIRRRWSRTDDSCQADCLTSSTGRSSLIRRHRPRSGSRCRSTLPFLESSLPHVRSGARCFRSVSPRCPPSDLSQPLPVPTKDAYCGEVRSLTRHLGREPTPGFLASSSAMMRARSVDVQKRYVRSRHVARMECWASPDPLSIRPSSRKPPRPFPGRGGFPTHT